MAAVFILNIT